jgi:hypothetical protein
MCQFVAVYFLKDELYIIILIIIITITILLFIYAYILYQDCIQKRLQKITILCLSFNSKVIEKNAINKIKQTPLRAFWQLFGLFISLYDG